MFEMVDRPTVKSGYQRQRAFKKTEKGRAAVTKYRQEKAERDYLTKPFVAWDGEGVTRVEGHKQDYVLFGNSNGDELAAGRAKYLSTRRIFEFALTRNQPGTINVIYGAGYDWNMWLRDVPRETLERLYKTGEVSWAEFWIKWRPGKTFHLGRKGMKESVLFYDVVSFFQRAFIKACDEYLGENFEDRDLIVKNKQLRGSFTDEDLAEMTLYYRAELRNLVSLMNELRERLHRAGLRVSRWDGPGAIAVAMFQTYQIKDALQRTAPAQIHAVRSAYFGGRFEVARTGYHNGDVYEYDLNSAYPWALQDVPVMAGGHWREEPGYVNPGTDFVLYEVEFHGRPANLPYPYPLPYRHDTGRVIFPKDTRGWYWGPEVFAAQKYVDQYGGSLVIHKTLLFEPATDARPFAFIDALYQKRRTLKANGDGAHVGIKLGLNSMYGKTAQQIGWHIDLKTGELRLPPYHQLEYAGYITSRCRAAVYEAVLPDLDAVIAFETDAVFVSRKLRVRESGALGGWEYTHFLDMAYLQSGTYFARTADGVVEKTRGVDRDTLHYDDALAALTAGLTHLPAKQTRFYGLGLGLVQNFAKWLTWDTTVKMLQTIPGAKRTHFHEGCNDCSEGYTLRERMHMTYPFSVPRDSISNPCALAWMDDTEYDEDAEDFRELTREEMSFYD